MVKEKNDYILIDFTGLIKAMFNSLKSDNKICEIMSYRAIDLNKIKDKDEKNKYKKLKKIWALPDNRSEREKENDFAEAFW